MSNSVAEAYLLIVRESNVPIFGEAVPVPFTGQIELDSWSWNIKNDVAVDRKKAEDKRKLDEKSEGKGASPTSNSTATPKDKSPPFKPDALIRQVAELQVKAGMAQPLRDKKVQELIKKAVLGFAEDAASGDDGKDDDADMKMKLTFEKGTDLSTHTAEDLARIAATLNKRPRPTLDLRTPAQALAELLANPAAA